MFNDFINTSIIKRAVGNELVKINTHDIRDFTDKIIGDYTCGGGAGLIMKPQPIVDCLKVLKRILIRFYYLEENHIIVRHIPC